MFRLSSLVVLLSLALEAWAGEALVQIQTKKEGPAGSQSIVQSIDLGSQATSYGLTYDISIPAGTPPDKCTSKQWIFKIGYIPLGMTSSGGPNWYTQGFLAVRLDGMSLHDIPATWRIVRAGGSDALTEATFQTPKGSVYLRLAMRGDDDKLLLQLALAPETKAQRVELSLIAYPQGFEKPWDRRITTAGRDLTPKAVKLDLAREPWALFSDPGMKPPRRRAGPCGLVCVPDELESASIGTGYSVNTTLKAKPDGRTITVGLWDFTAIGEADLMAQQLREQGAAIAADVQAVAKADWMSGALPAVRLSGSYAKLLAEIAARRNRSTPYDEMTRQAVTPHQAWAKPLAGGPVRVLVVAPRWYQRDTVELAQRFDMTYDTVSFETPQAITTSELYLYGSYELYGYPRKTAIGVLNALRSQLEARHDCVVLSGFQATLLPGHLRTLLLDRVRNGAGLILAGGPRELLSAVKQELRRAAWQPDVVPVEHLPALDKMVAQKRSPWTAYTLGRGRVLALNYSTGHNVLTPSLGIDDPDIQAYHDYYHSLAAAGVLWAAGREMPVRIRFDAQPGAVVLESDRARPDASLEVLVDQYERNCSSRRQLTQHLPQGITRLSVPCPGVASSPRWVTVSVREGGKCLGWATARWPAPADRPQIAAIELQQPSLGPGATLSGRVRLSEPVATGELELAVVDTLDRVVWRQTLAATAVDIPFRITLGQPLTALHTCGAILRRNGQLCDVASRPFTVTDRKIDDFHFLVWASGSNTALSHNILQALADHGADWIDNTGLGGGTTEQAAKQVLNAARHGLQSIPYITRISSEQMSGRVREPCLTDPKFLDKWTAGLRERAAGAARFAPPAYTLGDENYLVSRAPLDVCTSPTCLAAFRRELQASYGSLAALNAAWQTSYRQWDEAEPATLDEVRATPAHWPRWADHRQFMDRVFTNAHRLGREAIRSVDAGARVGFDGLFDLNSQHGYDFYQLCQACDMIQIYALHFMQVEYLRSFQQPGAIVGSWYNELGNRNEGWAKRMGWHLLFHRYNSSWYWMAYETGPALLFPDLRPTPQLLWMEQSIREIQAGIGKLLLHAQRQNDGIAVHYSQASVHANTLLGRNLNSAQTGVCRLLEDLGFQYDVLSYEQIDRGGLKDYRLLVLPSSFALTDAEVRAIRQFVARGGMLVADRVPGVLDGHCRPLATGALDDLFGVSATGLPKTPTGTETPSPAVRRAGPGTAALVNAEFGPYEGQRKSGAGAALCDALRKILHEGAVRPAVTVTADGQPSEGCEIVRFLDGDIQYLCVTRDQEHAGAKTQPVTIRLPKAAEVYDVRVGKCLGRASEFLAELVPGDPKVFALLPYAVGSVTVTGPKTVAGGATATFQVAIDVAGAPGDKAAGRHCLRVELLGPDGKVVQHYSRNVLLDKLKGKLSVDLALNDRPGKWQLRATDVASRRGAVADFRVATATGKK
jgi:hypothetical protein